MVAEATRAKPSTERQDLKLMPRSRPWSSSWSRPCQGHGFKAMLEPCSVMVSGQSHGCRVSLKVMVTKIVPKPRAPYHLEGSQRERETVGPI